MDLLNILLQDVYSFGAPYIIASPVYRLYHAVPLRFSPLKKKKIIIIIIIIKNRHGTAPLLLTPLNHHDISL